jgi:hypothetical protein
MAPGTNQLFWQSLPRPSASIETKRGKYTRRINSNMSLLQWLTPLVQAIILSPRQYNTRKRERVSQIIFIHHTTNKFQQGDDWFLLVADGKGVGGHFCLALSLSFF